MLVNPIYAKDTPRDFIPSEDDPDLLDEVRAAIAQLQAQAERYQIVLDNISPGVAFFDAEERMILCSRRYAEIYRLEFAKLTPGMTLKELIELRIAAGTCPMTLDVYLSFSRSITSRKQVRDWNLTLSDGRSIQVRHQPSPDGGWVSTHEDVTERQERRLLVGERLSLQKLIDFVPDNLWVKDIESRFEIANIATAQRMGYSTPAELIGKSDLELCPLETAQRYLADEHEVLGSGRPMIDREEYVLSPDGAKLWISTTKAPLRDETGHIIGIIGVSRDVSARHKAAALRDGEGEILEMVAAGAPIGSVLESLVHLIESQSPGTFGSVLLLNDDGLTLRHGAAPSLPQSYASAADDQLVAADSPPSGHAIYNRELIVAADIATDPSWAKYRELAETLGLRSSWSEPILSKSGEALGVFSIYSTIAHEPTDDELHLTHVATRMAAIALERERAERHRK